MSTPKVSITCTVDTTDATAGLGFEAWVDDVKFYDTDHVTGPQQIIMKINDADDQSHVVKFVMKNKTDANTQVDNTGAIITDARLRVIDMSFDEVSLGNMLAEHAVYTHDMNGRGSITQDKFYGEMGCNGTVSWKFTTPMYLWLLENM
jgi:hypothetical protein